MPLIHFQKLLHQIDKRLAHARAEDVPAILAPLSVDTFGVLMWRRDQLRNSYPALYKLLPALPPPDVQERFAGTSGEALLPMACAFMNYFEKMCRLHLSTPLSESQVIDYGCGWGRLTRFLLKFFPVSQIRALDPDADVLRYLDDSVLAPCTRVISRRPDANPVEAPAEVAFLFSILTHTPPTITNAIAHWLAHALKPGGLAIVTIRPRAYWHHRSAFPPTQNENTFAQAHDKNGFAFLPEGAGSEEYGDASYSDAFFLSLFPDFDVIDRTFTIVDPLQYYYTLKRR